VPCDPLLTRGRLPPRVQREKAFINQSTGVLQRFDFEPAGRIDPALFGLIRESCCGRLVGGKVKIRSFGPAMVVLFFFPGLLFVMPPVGRRPVPLRFSPVDTTCRH
jgi:hypothetical protein